MAILGLGPRLGRKLRVARVKRQDPQLLTFVYKSNDNY